MGHVHVVAFVLVPGDSVLLGHLWLLLLRLLHADALITGHGRVAGRRRGHAPPACYHQVWSRGTSTTGASRRRAADPPAENQPESRAAAAASRRSKRVGVHGQRSGRAHGDLLSPEHGRGAAYKRAVPAVWLPPSRWRLEREHTYGARLEGTKRVAAWRRGSCGGRTRTLTGTRAEPSAGADCASDLGVEKRAGPQGIGTLRVSRLVRATPIVETSFRLSQAPNNSYNNCSFLVSN